MPDKYPIDGPTEVVNLQEHQRVVSAHGEVTLDGGELNRLTLAPGQGVTLDGEGYVIVSDEVEDTTDKKRSEAAKKAARTRKRNERKANKPKAKKPAAKKAPAKKAAKPKRKR